jgi:hypothetical protein
MTKPGLTPSPKFLTYLTDLSTAMTSSTPSTDAHPVLHLYKIYASEFSLLSRWSVPGLDMDVQDERAWNACEQGDLDEFQKTREIMLEAWRFVVEHLEVGYERVEEAERECRSSVGARRHLVKEKEKETERKGLGKIYWESTPTGYGSGF